MSASVFADFRARSGGLWEQAQQHPFVIELGEGSLSRERFLHYMKQDYVYLMAYSRAISLGAAKAPGLGQMRALAEIASATLAVEMDLHRRACAALGTAPEELERVTAAPTCQAYSDFCIASALQGDSVDLLAALIPCAVGYAEIGARLSPRADVDHPYREWIQTYGEAEFQDYSAWMISAFDELAAGQPQWRKEQLWCSFLTGLRYEWLFWDMAWTLEDWPV